MGGVVSVLIKNEKFTIRSQQALPKKCRDPKIFSVPCTIGDCTFTNAMLDLGAINVMSSSIYKSLNFGDLEPMGMMIQLANRSILEDVLVQVNELIFPTNFYVLNMEDEKSGKGSTLILGQPLLITGRTKIDVHVGTLSMEFGDYLVQFNIFEAMKHPTKDHSLFGNIIDELVKEYMQLRTSSFEISNFVELLDVIDYFDSVTEVSDSVNMPNMQDLSDSMDNIVDLANLYAYLEDNQHFLVIIANNLHQEQEEKLLNILRKHKKKIGWTLSDLSGIIPSIYMHKILLEEEPRPIR
ncbi:hypothetical protein CR513_10053, partial [Mucuna pruriens]